MHIAIKDFNKDSKESSVTMEFIRILSYEAGDIIFMTKKPNRSGWFEGYRSNDPNRMCGISHVGSIKKINFA